MHVAFLPLIVVRIAAFGTCALWLRQHRAAVLLVLGRAFDQSLLSLAALAALVIVARAGRCRGCLFISVAVILFS